MQRTLGTFLVATLAALSVAQELRSPLSGNPLVPGYFADPCIRKFGDTYYLYSTPDGWGTGEGIPLIWTSKDFVNWTPHRSNWPQTPHKWAPSVVKANGKYYMFSSVPCQIWVGTAPTPLGPWTLATEQGPMLTDQTPPGTITLDAEVFQDDDGSAYMAYGTWWTPTIMKLRPDLLGPQGKIIQYFKKPQTTTPMGLIQGCMEAPYLLKRNGTYFLMYSDLFCQNSSYQVKYSTATSPFGPWTYGKNNPVLATNDDLTVEGPGHHSMLSDAGRDFIVYHRHAKPFQSQTMYRQVCADVIEFGGKDEILPVRPTHRGVGFLAPSTKRDTNWVVAGDAKVSATASSDAGSDYAPRFAADINNATLWKAESTNYPQWLQIDLGKMRSIKRTEIDFQYPQMTYLYTVSVSSDGKNWKTFADHSGATDWRYAVDSVSQPVDARYVRVTLLGDRHPDRPNKEIGIWNVKVYDGVDKPLGAPTVSAGARLVCTIDAPRVRLKGFVRDHALPCTSEWRQVSGPGRAVFSRPSDPDSDVVFPAAGRYVLELVGKNRSFAVSDRVEVLVKEATSPLIANYEFEESLGEVVVDGSSTSKDGWLGSDGDLKTPPVRSSGATGQGLVFDGYQSYVALPALGNYRNFAFASWVKLDQLKEAVLFASKDGAAKVSIEASGELRLSLWTGSAGVKLPTDVAGRWTHIVVEYSADQGKARISINGKPSVWQSLGGGASVDLRSGARLGGDPRDHLLGKLDNVRLYRALLSDAELAAISKPLPRTTIATLGKLKEGQVVELRAVSVIYAPRGRDDARSTSWFMVADDSTDRALSVRSESGAVDSVEEDRGVTLRGTLKTDPATSERYLALVGTPEIESAPILAPRTIDGFGQLAPRTLVRIRGTVKSITQDRLQVQIADAQGSTIAVRFEGAPLRKSIAAGNEIEIEGVSRSMSTVLYAKTATRIVPAIPPLERDLLCHLQFEEDGGTLIKNLTGETGDAKIIGPISRMPGRSGKAIQLSGERNSIELPEMGTYRVCTLAAWIKPDVLRPWMAIFHNDGFEPARKLHLSMHEDGRLLLAISGNNPTDVRTAVAFAANEANTWKHVALVYDSAVGVSKFYVNGVLLSEHRYRRATPIGFVGGMKIGSWGDFDRFYKGQLDDFRIYGRGLSSDEIRQLAGS